MSDRSDLDEKITDLKIELVNAEDRHSTPDWIDRDAAIRAEIRRLERERDLKP